MGKNEVAARALGEQKEIIVGELTLYKLKWESKLGRLNLYQPTSRLVRSSINLMTDLNLKKNRKILLAGLLTFTCCCCLVLANNNNLTNRPVKFLPTQHRGPFIIIIIIDHLTWLHLQDSLVRHD